MRKIITTILFLGYAKFMYGALSGDTVVALSSYLDEKDKGTLATTSRENAKIARQIKLAKAIQSLEEMEIEKEKIKEFFKIYSSDEIASEAIVFLYIGDNEKAKQVIEVMKNNTEYFDNYTHYWFIVKAAAEKDGITSLKLLIKFKNALSKDKIEELLTYYIPSKQIICFLSQKNNDKLYITTILSNIYLYDLAREIIIPMWEKDRATATEFLVKFKDVLKPDTISSSIKHFLQNPPKDRKNSPKDRKNLLELFLELKENLYEQSMFYISSLAEYFVSYAKSYKEKASIISTLIEKKVINFQILVKLLDPYLDPYSPYMLKSRHIKVYSIKKEFILRLIYDFTKYLSSSYNQVESKFDRGVLNNFLGLTQQNQQNTYLTKEIFIQIMGENPKFKFTEEEMALSFTLCFFGNLFKTTITTSPIFRFLDEENIMTISKIFISMFKNKDFIKECLLSKIWDGDYQRTYYLSEKLRNNPQDFFAYAFNASFPEGNPKRKEILDSIKRIIPNEWKEFERILDDAASSPLPVFV